MSITNKELLNTLKNRFDNHQERHKNIQWKEVLKKLQVCTEKLETLRKMEETGGEPDVIDVDGNSGEYIFCDCSAESPKERRSFCYDRAALDKRKENKPKNDAIKAADEIGIELLDEQEYRHLQTLGQFDNKTSSWIKTPDHIRKLGGAIFGDFRYGTVFIYHNGAESYYAGRGFRGKIRV